MMMLRKKIVFLAGTYVVGILSFESIGTGILSVSADPPILPDQDQR